VKHDAVLPAPFHAGLADAPPGATCVWLQAGAARIRVAWWKAGDKGTVLLLPGRTECVEKYGRAAGDLVARGFSVITIDWRGQGLADRALPDRREGHVGDFSEDQQDLDAMLAEATRAGLPQPWFMLAHSMGGCIGLRGGFRTSLRTTNFYRASFFFAWVSPSALAPVCGPVSSLQPSKVRGSRPPPRSTGSAASP
jgi:lysophospholipase